MKTSAVQPAEVSAPVMYKALNQYRVRHLRVTVTKLAGMIGVEPWTLMRTLGGRHIPRDYTHYLIEQYFRANEDEILTALSN